MKLLFAFLALVLLVACSTSPVEPESASAVPTERIIAYQDKPTGDYGTIVVTRDTGFMGGGCKAGVWIDGVKAAIFATGETATFYRPAGVITLSVGPGSGGLCASWDRRTIETTVKTGQTRRYRIALFANGGLSIEPD